MIKPNYNLSTLEDLGFQFDERVEEKEFSYEIYTIPYLPFMEYIIEYNEQEEITGDFINLYETEITIKDQLKEQELITFINLLKKIYRV